MVDPFENLEPRIAQVLDALRQLEEGPRAQSYDRIQVSGTQASKLHSQPPPGVDLANLDSEKCPPISISPYAHFSWMLDGADDRQKVGLLHAAERLLMKLSNPHEPGTDDERTLMVQGARSGEEIAERIIVMYLGYDCDTVDLIEGVKPGTTYKVRKSNFLDEMGNPSGVPKWLYPEFDLIDSFGGRDVVINRFGCSQSSYYDIKSKIKAMKISGEWEELLDDLKPKKKPVAA